MTYELKQQAIDLMTSMNHEELSLLLRVWNHGMECVHNFIASCSCGYSEAVKFVEEWEAQHECRTAYHQ